MNFHTLLKESIEDESEGIARYEKLAAIAPSEYAPILHDIAKEETQHLEFLSEIAGKTGHMDDEDGETPSKSEEPNSSLENQFEQIHAAMNEIKKMLLDVLDELKTTTVRTDRSDDSNTGNSSVENDENKFSMNSEKTPVSNENETVVESSAMPQAFSAQTIR